jgi:hypothetical protein
MRQEKRSSRPWSLVRNSGSKKALTVNDRTGMPILKFYVRGNEEADGHLIAASPDLLALAHRSLAFTDDILGLLEVLKITKSVQYDSAHALRTELIAAIDKAQGGAA